METYGLVVYQSRDQNLQLFENPTHYILGGVTNGHDVVAAYLHTIYPAPLVNTVLAVADIAPRPAEYQTTPIGDMMYVLVQIIRAIPSSIAQLFINR